MFQLAHWGFNFVYSHELINDFLIWFRWLLWSLCLTLILTSISVRLPNQWIHLELLLHVQRVHINYIRQRMLIVLHHPELTYLFLMQFRIQAEEDHIDLIFKNVVRNHILKQVSLDVALLHSELVELQKLAHDAVDEAFNLLFKHFHIVFDSFFFRHAW